MEAEKAIRRTVNYAQKYKQKLTYHQLRQRLLGGKELTDEEIEKAAKGLTAKRNSQEKVYREKMKKARFLAKKLKRFKDILLVGVTGSVAAEFPKREDDIDLLVITKNRRLWLTRLRVWRQLKLEKIAIREQKTKEVKDSFCFNIWLEEGSLTLPVEKRNLKNAVDLVLMKPVLDRKGVYQKFLKNNDWVKRYVATPYRKLVRRDKKIRKEKENGNRIGDLINWMALAVEYFYMKKKITAEKITPVAAFFHPEISRKERKGGAWEKVVGAYKMGAIFLGMGILGVSIIRSGLERTMFEEREGKLRKIPVIFSGGIYRFPESGSLPDSGWYGTKKMRDGFWRKMVEEKDEERLKMLIADRKMMEAKKLTEKGKIELAERTVREAIEEGGGKGGLEEVYRVVIKGMALPGEAELIKMLERER